VRLRDLNPFWRQLPVYSPITFGSLWAGLAGALGWGEPLERLRQLLSSEYGTTDVLLLDSGTSALRLAIEGACAETGSDIVALPAYCCFDVATAAVGADARVALYDIRPETLGPDFDSLRNALVAGARVVVVAHLYGIPVDLDRSRELSDEYGAVLIEDAAQGAGGSWRGEPLGSWGDLGILSFGRGKGRTGGGGGALLANDSRGRSILAGAPAVNRAGGGHTKIAKLAAQWAFGRPSLYGIPASLPFLGLGETTYKEPWEPQGMATGPAAALLVNWEPSKREEEVRREAEQHGLVSTLAVRISSNDTRAVPGNLRIPSVTSGEFGWPSSGSKFGWAEGYPLSLADLPVLTKRLVVDEASGARRLARNLVTVPATPPTRR
jgi:hypothetical protein